MSLIWECMALTRAGIYVAAQSMGSPLSHTPALRARPARPCVQGRYESGLGLSPNSAVNSKQQSSPFFHSVSLGYHYVCVYSVGAASAAVHYSLLEFSAPFHLFSSFPL